MQKSKYKLLEPFVFPVSGIKINNRIVLAPMTTYSGNEDGTVSDQEIAYYKRRNRSAGLLISACAYVIPQGKAFPGQIGAHTNLMIPSLKRISEALKENGEKAVLQIHHGGRMSAKEQLPDGQCLSASAVAAEREGAQIPREMTEPEIEETILAYGLATRRAIQAGFDGVEIHGANTYLLQQFFSPHSNKRSDKWGGNLLKRMRFPLAVADEVIRVVRKQSNRPFLVGYRISPEEVENPGIQLEDTLVLIEELSRRNLDYIHVSTMNYFGASLRNPQDLKPRTQIILEKLNHTIPIIGVGSVQTPIDAQKILNNGADLVALGRALLIDPEWLLKIKKGKEDTIETAFQESSRELVEIPSKLWNVLLQRKGWVPFK
ncbi:MAG: NADH-dependent flavin oxidoreductase [Bacteroidales bacterium]|nr:NADH-dependent flavin oxidoreductase [Bacteroidales bacterium]